jgi:hypothetical protein
MQIGFLAVLVRIFVVQGGERDWRLTAKVASTNLLGTLNVVDSFV